ncbi:hypothetical protein L6452_44646 [Arctium lappa]|uniref:Uncharacterized protein n=1 Tax=Arctium lappa TaxID=4217 RepID=A0ACB8XGZ3_ARCLA|nr:hypothetical protein L6452_44646 [Arctium lappa]
METGTKIAFFYNPFSLSLSHLSYFLLFSSPQFRSFSNSFHSSKIHLLFTLFFLISFLIFLLTTSQQKPQEKSLI